MKKRKKSENCVKSNNDHVEYTHEHALNPRFYNTHERVCMCHSESPQSTTESANKRSCNGLPTEPSIRSTSQVDREDIKSEEVEIRHSPKKRNPKRKKSAFAIAGSPLKDNETTSNDKPSTCDPSTQGGKLSRTSEAGSAGKEKVLKPFFDDACKDLSRRLRWHTKTGCQGSDTKYSNSSWQSVESNCCATIKMYTGPERQSWQRTSCQSSLSSARVFMDSDTTKRVRTVILMPSKEVHAKLRQWMGVCRLTYNTALAYIKSGKQHRKHWYWLRNRFVNECNVPKDKQYILDTPKHVRESALKDLSKAYVANFAVQKKNPNRKFDMQFRSKKKQNSCTIPKDHIKVTDNGIVIYPKMLSKDPIPISGKICQPTGDCRLTQDCLGRWMLHVPTEVRVKKIVSENQAERWCALDPGVRTFLTSWSPDGRCFKLGDEVSCRLYTMLTRMDKLQGDIDKTKGRRKNRKRKAMNRLKTRIQNVKRDLHYQCANFLAKRYSDIIIPVFGSKDMSSRAGRKLRTKTVRSMLGLGHYAFRQRLKDTCTRWGVTVHECSEEYTSKTCSCCGWINDKLGGSKVFKCKECGHIVDRDMQGAFNIYLKHSKNAPNSE